MARSGNVSRRFAAAYFSGGRSCIRCT